MFDPTKSQTSKQQHSTATFIYCLSRPSCSAPPLPSCAVLRRRHQIPNRNPAAIRSLRAKSAHASSAFRLTPHGSLNCSSCSLADFHHSTVPLVCCCFNPSTEWGTSAQGCWLPAGCTDLPPRFLFPPAESNPRSSPLPQIPSLWPPGAAPSGPVLVRQDRGGLGH